VTALAVLPISHWTMQDEGITQSHRCPVSRCGSYR